MIRILIHFNKSYNQNKNSQSSYTAESVKQWHKYKRLHCNVLDNL